MHLLWSICLHRFNVNLIVCLFPNHLRVQIFYFNYWSYSHEQIHVFFEELCIVAKGCEHLRCALTMSDVGNLFDACVGHDVLPESGLIKLSHFLEGKTKIFWKLVVNVKAHMISRVPVASGVVHPEIIALFYQADA